ncbi:MAG TPA: DegQ family serine endoprotease [Burkholderiales bacterium]|nr:DegQ family serine endoprotease [Burkholderiales bacterium]
MFRQALAATLLALLPVAAPAQVQGLPDFTDLVEKQGPAVVNVSTTSTARGGAQSPVPEDDPFYDFFRRFGPQQPRDYEARSLGSGFIISADGTILTNAHVVDAADEVTVKLSDKREFKAKVIGSDKRTDVAVIKIEAAGLPVVKIGDPEKLKVGEWVLAIGSPFGFESTVTAGIVSAKGRSLPQENYVPFIQTDVAINPGNSGGPLFNLKGEVVGINSQIYSRTGGFMGLSFAIPIDVATDVANQLKSSGRVSRGRIGVTIQEITRELAESFKLPKAAGALVTSVEKGSPADKAGVQVSDVIVKFDGREVGSSVDLPRIVAQTRPGSKVNMELWRNGAAKEISVTVGEMPEDKSAQRPGRKENAKPGNMVGRLGLMLSELTAEQRRELKIAGGLLVEDVQGPALKAGIRRGDILMAVNNQDVKSLDQLNQVLGQLEKARSVALLIKRGDGALYVPLRLDGGN